MIPGESNILIMLDKPRMLRWDLYAMAKFQEATGINPLKEDIMGRDLSPKEIMALLWSCLLHEDKSLTLADVGHMVHMGNCLEVQAYLQQAYLDALPEMDEKAEAGDEDPLASRPVGTSSGQLGGMTLDSGTKSSGDLPTGNSPP